ncbi:MAG: hypothetical protein JXJ04_05690 [Spirochaetales bacterium]|nr:hypothetical protein [Spirochaetales bacterium]
MSIPHYGSITDLDHILAKTISYEDAVDRGWRKKILLPIVPAYPILNSHVLGEAIKNDFCNNMEWNYYRLYDEIYPYTDLPVYNVSNLCPLPESQSCNIPKVVDAWTNYRPGLVVWNTHGWPAGAVDILDSASAAYLNDDYPSMTFQVSCNNSWPEEPDNLAYSILRNGGITTIGATRISFGG